MKIYIKKKYAIISTLIVLAAIIIDFVTKRIVMANMTEGQSIPLIQNVLHITYITNTGAAFGSLSGARWLFMTLSTIMILVLIALLIFWDERNKLFYASVSMIIGGGIGNMIDRIFYGAVVDFIDFRAFDFWIWIFNGADSFVCVGVGLLLIYYISSEIKYARLQKAADAERAEADNSAGESDE